MDENKTQLKIIEWIDSSLQNGQVDHLDYPKPERIVSVGWIVEETSDYITLARDHIGDDFRGLLCIPKVCFLNE